MVCLLWVKERNTAVNKIFQIKPFTRESRIILLLSLLLSFSTFAYSQRKSDIGIFAGTSYYMGELNPVKHFNHPGYAIGPIFRYNFELRNSLRFSGIYHDLKGDATNYGEPYVEYLNSKFDATFIDFTANYEINFIPYKTANKTMNQSLYLSAGLGYHFALSAGTNNHFIVPFGIGYKFNLAKKLSAGAELSIRKTFNDIAIDGIPNISGIEKNLFGNNDWYTFAGIFISYKIFNFREECYAYD